MAADTAEVVVNAQLSAKDEVRALLDRLPDSVTLEDIAYHLDVVIKVLEAEAQLDRGEGIPQEEFDRRVRPMARHIVWSAGAEADLAEIGSYLERVASLAVASVVSENP